MGPQGRDLPLIPQHLWGWLSRRTAGERLAWKRGLMQEGAALGLPTRRVHAGSSPTE